MLLKTQLFEKNAIIPVEIKFWLISSRIIECDKPQGTLSEGPTGSLTIIMEVIRSFLQHQVVV